MPRDLLAHSFNKTVRRKVALSFFAFPIGARSTKGTAKVKTLRALNEERSDLAVEAQGIWDATDGKRDMTDEESARFKEITATDTGLIAVIDCKIKQAKEREAAVIAIQKREENKSAVDRIKTVLGERTLPTNGILPSEENEPQRVYVKTAKLKAFKTEREAYDAGMYYRAILSRFGGRGEDIKAIQHCHRIGFDVTNAAYEGSGTAGGYLVPPQIASTIIEVRENVGVARRVCSIQPMTSDMMSIPKRSGGLTVYYPNELAAITDSDKSWSQIALAAQKRAVASKISQELVEDALISIADNVVSEQAYALALQEDNELINGTGASSYGNVQGLLSKIGSAGVVTATTGNDTWPELTLADVMAAMSKLPDRFNRMPAWVCSHNFYWGVFARLLASGGGNGVQELQTGDGGRRTFFGTPVFLTSQMPTATAAATVCALFGQFDMAVVLGDRTGIRIGRDDSVGFLSDYTTLKATARYDMFVHEPGDSSNPGAYVALKTAS